jgi:hypothetical protein
MGIEDAGAAKAEMFGIKLFLFFQIRAIEREVLKSLQGSYSPLDPCQEPVYYKIAGMEIGYGPKLNADNCGIM